MQAPNEASNKALELENKYQHAKAEQRNGNKEAARSIFEKLANQDNCRKSQLALGLMYQSDGDQLTAFHYVQLSANQKHPVAELCLSNYWLQGIGTTVDVEKAFDYCKRAADGGLTEAQFAVSNYYESGTGTSKDGIAAIKYLIMASLKNSIHAFFKLGKIYLAGELVPTSKQRAIHYFKKAKEVDFDITESHIHLDATLYLGDCYLSGEGKNLSEATKIFNDLITHTHQYKKISKLVSKNAAQITYVEFDTLIQYALEVHNNDLFNIYYESFKIQLKDITKSNLNEQDKNKIIKRKQFYDTLKTLEPNNLMQHAFNELKKPSDKINSFHLRCYLNKALSHNKEDNRMLLAEVHFYYGLCDIYGIFDKFDNASGFKNICTSGWLGFERAQEFSLIMSNPNPRFAVSVYLKEANHAYEQKLFHLAKSHYQEALNNKIIKGDAQIDTLFKIAMCDMNMGYLSKAELRLSKLLDQKPSHQEALDKLMECQVKNAHLDNAIDRIKANRIYLEHLKKNMAKNPWMKTLYAAYQHYLGKERLHKNDMQGGFLCFQKAAELSNQAARLELAICYFEGWGTPQNLEQAYVQFSLNVSNPHAIYYMGIMLKHGLGKIQDKRAADAFLRSPDNPFTAEYEQKSTTATGFIDLGDTAFEKKMYQLALCYYLDALEKESANADALLKAGLCYLRKNKLDEAHPYIQQALQINPEKKEAILANIEYLALMNNLQMAIALVEVHKTLWLSFIVQTGSKEPWIKKLMEAFDKHDKAKITRQKEQTVSKTNVVEKPEPKPVSVSHLKKTDVKKRDFKKTNQNPHFTPGFIESCRKDLDSCENADKFLFILDKIIFGNTPKILQEACAAWFSKHPGDREYILEKMAGKGDVFQKYKLKWEQLPIMPVMVPEELFPTDAVEKVVEEASAKMEIPQIPLGYPQTLSLFHKGLPIKKGIFSLEELEKDVELNESPNVESSKPQKVAFNSPFNLFQPDETEIDGEISYQKANYPFDFSVIPKEDNYLDPIFLQPAYHGEVTIYITLQDKTLKDRVHDYLSNLTQQIMKKGIPFSQTFDPQVFINRDVQIVLKLVTNSVANHEQIQKIVTVFSQQVMDFRESYAFSNPGCRR